MAVCSQKVSSFLKRAAVVAVGVAAVFAAGGARAAVKLTLTFDDSTKDHIDVAAPLLAKHGWKGTFNVVTDLVGHPNRLTWDDIRSLQRQGHVIASHTATHPDLAALLAKGETNEVRRQYRASYEAILRETGRAPRYMCYPYSQRNAVTDALCREEGMLPMSVVRTNFGKGTKAGTPTGVGAAIDRWIADGRTCMDVLVHGVCPDGGWFPFDSAADYAAFLDEIAERERRGQVKVVPYDEFADFPDVTRWHGANLLGLFTRDVSRLDGGLPQALEGGGSRVGDLERGWRVRFHGLGTPRRRL